MTSIYIRIIGSFSVSNICTGTAEKKEGTLTVAGFIRRCYGTLWILKDRMVILCWRARGISEEQALFYRCPSASSLVFFPFSEKGQTLRTWCRTRTLLRSLLSPTNISPKSKEKWLVPGSDGTSTETSGCCVCVGQRNASASTLSPHTPWN